LRRAILRTLLLPKVTTSLLADQAVTATTPCRLCARRSDYVFTKRLLDRYSVAYYRCTGCNSIQTEVPHWLADAYRPENERFDTGQVIRCLHNAAFLFALTRFLGIDRSTIVDYGCGSGLLVRLLRDSGLDAFGLDQYAEPRLAVGFMRTSLSGASVINLCEVAEHFDQPAKSFAEIFAPHPQLVVMQTGIQDHADPDWDYLAPEHGQHVFFYSIRAIQFLAERYQMHAIALGGYVAFLAPPLMPRALLSDRSRVHPDLERQVGSALPQFMQMILATGYRYAIEDNRTMSRTMPPPS
jgi:hypothetical protein